MIITQVVRNNKKVTNNLDGRSITESLSHRYGIWAIVSAVHSDSVSVDVTLETGFSVKYIPVASREWFNDSGENVSGERDLPTVGSRVFIFMPDKRIETGFVLCSGYNPLSAKGEAALSESGKENERLYILPGNWKRVYDYITGDFTETSPDELIKVTVKPADTVEILAFDTKITAAKDDSLTIEAFDCTIIIKDGDVSLVGKKVTLSGTDVVLTGGKLTTAGSASPSGSGPYCGIPVCPFTGAPHVGNIVMGT